MIKKGQKVYFWLAGFKTLSLVQGVVTKAEDNYNGVYYEVQYQVPSQPKVQEKIVLRSLDCFVSKQEAITYKVHTQTYEIEKAMDTLAGAKLAIETCFQLLSEKRY